jgi:hypothetical protein
MKKFTQKELKMLVKLGAATDISNGKNKNGLEWNLDALYQNTEKVGVSHGKYGINGGLLKDKQLNIYYVIIGRSSLLFRFF